MFLHRFGKILLAFISLVFSDYATIPFRGDDKDGVDPSKFRNSFHNSDIEELARNNSGFVEVVKVNYRA